jgi:glutathione S-transferase
LKKAPLAAEGLGEDAVQKNMITVHHLEKSRSTRVLWLLEELGLEYELKEYKRDPKTMLAPSELRKVHPLGKAPVITDGDRTIAESAVILDYIVEHHGNGRLIPPPNTPERLRYTYWMHYAEGSAMPPLLLKLIFETIKKKAPFVVRPVAKAIAGRVLNEFVDPQIMTHFDWVESELGKSTWLAGEELTAADIQMSFPIEANDARVGSGDRPRLKAFIDRIHARPAYKRAIEKGGPLLIS